MTFILLIYYIHILFYRKKKLFVIICLVPNTSWYVNIFLIINKLCVTNMFFNAIMFAYCDKISNNLKIINTFYR